MSITTTLVLMVGMLLFTYLLTLLLRPKSGARLGGQLGKAAFVIETKDRNDL